MFVSAGCSGDGQTNASPVPATTNIAQAEPSQTSASNAPGEKDRTTLKVADRAVSKAATSKFGRDGAVAGAEAALAFSERAFYDDECMTTKPGRNVDKCAYALGDYMTPSSRTDWNNAVRTFVKKARDGEYDKDEAFSTVYSLCFYGGMPGETKDEKGRTITASDGPVWVNKNVRKVSTDLTNDGRLEVALKSSADMRVTVDGKPKAWTVDRDVTYYMVENDGEWKIDAWRGRWAVSNAKK